MLTALNEVVGEIQDVLDVADESVDLMNLIINATGRSAGGTSLPLGEVPERYYQLPGSGVFSSIR